MPLYTKKVRKIFRFFRRFFRFFVCQGTDVYENGVGCVVFIVFSLKNTILVEFS